MESNFIRMLVRIFICENEDSSSRKMAAGGALALLSLHTERTARCILKADDDVLDHISKILLNVQLQNKVYRIKAAQILENLCSQYNTDDECLNKLKIVMTDVMPKVANPCQVDNRSVYSIKQHI
jgi:BRCT domain type II-containing protein